MAVRYSGTVKSFRGQWGFLTADGVEGDVFLHVKDSPAVANSVLKVGETLEFDLSSGGPNNEARALNATRPDGGNGESYDGIGGGGGGGEGVLAGTVKSFRHGWGLIMSASLEGRLFFGERHNPRCREGLLLPGDEVTFEIAQNPANGRDMAVNVQVAVKDQSELLGQRVGGLVKSFQDGWGFATSPRFQGTVLLGRKHVMAAGIALQVGEQVEFVVSTSPNGKYEATGISKAGMGAMPMAPPPRFALTNNGGAARDRSRSAGQGQYHGQVKTFRDGWGFLFSDQLPGDIYVKMRDSPSLGEPLQQGETVSFDLVYRNDQTEKNNGATAVNVQRLGGHGGPAAAQRQTQWQGRPMAAPSTGAVSTQHTGTLVEFKPPPESWGWLESPSCPSQVFFGLRDNPQLQAMPKVGDSMVFELGAGPKGRSKAINVATSMVGQRVQGVISNLYEGWGFASTDGIAGKVMVGKKSLMASGLDATMFQVGETLEFELNMAAKGYEALNIKKV